MRTLIALILAILASAAVHAQNRHLYDDFETGSVSASWNSGPKCPVVSTAADGGSPYAGSFMARCNWDGVGCVLDMDLHKDPFPGINEYFVRHRFRYDANVDSAFGAKLVRLSFGGSPAIIYGAQMEQAGGPLWFEADIGGLQQNFTAGNVDDGQWHLMEVYVKGGTGGTAVVKQWLDDVLKSSWTGSVTTVKFDAYFNSNWSCNGGIWNHDATNYTYYDNIELYSDNTSSGSPATSGTMANGDIQVDGGAPVRPRSRTFIIGLGFVFVALAGLVRKAQ